MATRTFGVSNGNWSDSTKWLESAVPTAADDVVFLAASANCTIDAASVCRSIDCDGATSYGGVLTHNAFTLTIGDGTAGANNRALRFSSGMTYTKSSATTSAISFVSTSTTQQTITIAGKTLGNVTFNGSTGTWQLADALIGSGNWTFTAGSWDSNSQNITLNGVGRILVFGSKTYTGTVTISGSQQMSVQGTNTFTNLTVNGSAAKTDIVSFSASQTISTLLTIAGNSKTNRLQIISGTLGTAITLTAASVSINAADLRDITAAGAANWNISGASNFTGDCGGNTGITFTTAATQTATGTASFSWSTHGWTSRVPLPQDDVVINNAFVAGRTVTLDMPRAGKSISWTGATGNPTWAKTSATVVYGSITMIDTMTNSGTSAITMEGRGAFTITGGTGTFTNPLTISMVGGSLSHQDTFTSSSTLTLTHGEWNQNGQSTTFTTYNGSASTTRTFTLGSGTLTLSGAITVFTHATATNLTVTATTGTIKLTDTSNTVNTFAGGGKTYGNLWIARGTGIGTIIISGSNTFSDFKDDGTAGHRIQFTAGTTQTVTTFIVSGNSGNEIELNSTTTATYALVKSGGGTISRDFLNIQHCVATPSSTWYAGTHSTNNQAVATAGSGWTFTDAPVTYTATVGCTAGAAVAAITATFVKPTYTATIGATCGAATASASAQFTKPTYMASVSSSAGPVTASISAQFTKPAYTASIAALAGGSSAIVSAQFAKPTYTAIVTTTSAAASASVAAQFSKPTYAATVSVNCPATIADCVATFTKPTYTTIVSAASGAASATVSAAFVKPVYTAVISASVIGASASIAAIFTKPTYTATITAACGSTTASATATFAVNTFTAIVSAITGPTTAICVATFVKPTYTAMVAAICSPATSQVVATFVKPSFTASITATCAPAVISVAAEFTPATTTSQLLMLRRRLLAL